jgi:hypothetical protein
LEFDDFCEKKNVKQGTMYLDFSGTGEIDQMVHVGRTGSFVPVTSGGGTLWRVKDGEKFAVTGTKGLQWIRRDAAIDRGMHEGDVNLDMAYFEDLKRKAFDAISKYVWEGDLEWFVS